MLLEHLDDDEKAIRLHQPFKLCVIGRLPMDVGWTVPSLFVLDHAKQIEALMREITQRG